LVQFAAVQCGTSLAEVLRQTLRGLFLPAVVAFGSAVQLMGWLGSGGWLPLLATCIAAGLLFAASFLAVGSRHEDRQLLFEVMFGHATRADGAPSDGMLKRLRWLRSLRDFLVNLRYYLYDESHTRPDHYQALFRDANDPWRYRTSPERGSDRFAAALEMLDAVRPEGRLFGEVLEIGCAEGLFTELLASRCDRLLAVDVSDIALGRARDRCRSRPDVSFRSWDLLRDPPLADRYDLVVVMAVLDNFVRIRQQKLLRSRIVDLVRPGGYLLVESTRTGGDLEDTWWRRAFHRGKWLNHYVAQHPALETIEVRITPICVQTLCRKRS
jgi:SAM-dependent methyltransferase